MLILVFILLIFAGIGYLITSATAGIIRMFLPKASHIPISSRRNKSKIKWMVFLLIFLFLVIICNL